MAEGRGLIGELRAAGGSAAPDEADLLSETLGEDHAPAGGAIHAALAVVLVLGALVLPAEGRSSSAWHAGVEAAAIALAATLGGLGLVRYYSRRQRAFLYIGTGFLAAAALDAFHLLLVSGHWFPHEVAAEGDLSAWSWMQGRTFLALFLAVSVIAPRLAPPGSHEPGRGGERSVYLVALALTTLVVAFFWLAPVTSAIHTGAAIPRPSEFVPALLFGLAYAGYYRRGRWRTDPFEHWLLVSLLVSALLHALYMSRSAALGDPRFDAAHLLKVASYGTVLIGLMVSTFQTFRREGRVLEAITGSNDALAREVEVRRRAERVLQRSEERLQNFLDNAHDLILSTAPDGRILYVNAAWSRTLGYAPADLEDLRLPDLLHPDCRERVMAAFRHVLAGEDMRRLTADFVARDGRVVVCSGSATRHTEDGVPVSTQAIFRDVTEQRRAERDLAASRANLAALVENTGDAIWSVDTRQRLVTFNSAFALAVEARSGREPRVGDTPEAVFGAGQARWYRDLYDRVLSGERFSALLEERLERQERVVEIFCNPVLEASGTTGAVMFGKDVTRRLRAEEALRVAKEDAELANRAKSQFLANMSHELRTPLNSVIGFANILLKNKKENLTQQDVGFLDRILANGRHLLALINEVLDLAKIEAGRMELELRATDLGELVQETVDQLEGQAREKRVTLVAEVPAVAQRIETDPPKLKQVIINLVGNAMKFTEGGRVTVRVELGPDGLAPDAVAVEDTGIGIPQDRLDAIFEAFQQADGGTARKYGGTGLGLTISRSICNLLGYELTVTSEVGRGSTFTIHLTKDELEVVPVPPHRHRLPESASEPDPPLRGAPEVGADDEIVGVEPAPRAARRLPRREGREDFRVLVIDDEVDSRVLMTHYLHDLGCVVQTAASAAEGLALAREQPPDLITLDLMMPEMSGWEALRTLKADAELRDIPVVVVSIVAAEGRGRLLGAVDLLTKPVDRDDLLRVLWRNLVRHGPARVLLVEDDADVRLTVSRYLRDAGLGVRAVANGSEALRAVEEEAPDAVVLDLMMPVMDGFTFLDRLRETPYHAGLPVVVLTGRALSTEDHARLTEKASSVVEKGAEVEARLREVLGSFLPLGDP
jgi:PAS domain S-box-containing protein